MYLSNLHCRKSLSVCLCKVQFILMNVQLFYFMERIDGHNVLKKQQICKQM